jgi:signal transduction histidine kinase
VPGARPGRVPAGLAERAALLGGTVEVTSCREAISVRVVLPVAGPLPVAVATSVAA